MFNKRLSKLILILILVLGLGTGCKEETTDENAVTVSGSTSVGPLVEKEQEAFKSSNPEISIQVQQLGSSAGIKDAINGTSQIGMSSRDLKDEEKSQGLKEVEIAYDGIAIITNKENPLKELTIDQVKDIYAGKITNWKELGWKDEEIVVISREDGSGTRDAFQTKVGYSSEELIPNALIGDGSGNIKSTVVSNVNTIGFISFEYIDDSINALTIENVEPKPEYVLDKTYKISRPFLLVYKEENLKEDGKKFIEFILSDEGQNIVEKSGLIKIK